MAAVGDTPTGRDHEPTPAAAATDATDAAAGGAGAAGPDAVGAAGAPPAGPVLGPQAERTRAVVLAIGQPRPTFPADLADRLRERLEEGLAPVVARLGAKDSLRITKHDLTTVFGCERRFRDDGEFVPSLATVRGTVVHRALARMVVERRSPTPLDAAEEAVAAMADHTGWYAEFLRSLSDDDRSELVGEVANVLTAFVTDWPPVRREWTPRVEFTLRVELCDRRVSLMGRPDLALGKPVGTTAKVLMVDFKTGWVRPEHREDLRFYALLETLTRVVPPFRGTTYYPESGEHVSEDVTEAMLWSAVRRVVDGADRIEAVRARRRPAVETPGSACGFCGQRPDCETGTAHVAARRAEWDDPDDGEPDPGA
jgi:hypothetical protein